MNRRNCSIPGLPIRERTGHKGTYGTALLITGSLGMGGAAVLAGTAALKSGVGLVRLLVPEPIQTTVASFRAEYTVFPFPSDRDGRFSHRALSQILFHIPGANAVGIGPGIARSLGLDLIVSTLFASLTTTAVFDADALNALAYRESFTPPAKRKIFTLTEPSIAGARILTPHPGEFFRMSGVKLSADPKERAEAAKYFVRLQREIYSADSDQIVLVLKGAGTVVTDGDRIYVNETGNPGMGTGGSGDVLTGIITALAAQKISPFNAAVLGVYLHGMAGDLAAESKGENSLTAEDILDFLPEAFKRLNPTCGTASAAQRQRTDSFSYDP